MYYALLTHLEHVKWLDKQRFATPGKGPRNSFAYRNKRYLKEMENVQERIAELEQVVTFMILQHGPSRVYDAF
jgi:hypothetical protein